MNIIEHYSKNEKGQDYVVGDIHGMFALLYQTLLDIRFDFEKDRLFSVGDLCDRGPDSDQVLKWLEFPWFFPIKGNHEEIIIDYEAGLYNDLDLSNVGAAWWLDYPKDKKKKVLKGYKELPLLIDVETEQGLVGIVHAECPHADWLKLPEVLQSPYRQKMINKCLWSMDSRNITYDIKNVVAVIVGHMTKPHYKVAGNTHLIDTGAVYDNGYFTILDLKTLSPVEIFGALKEE